MKILSFIICFAITINVFSQNNPPIAVNDSVYATYNDSIMALPANQVEVQAN